MYSVTFGRVTVPQILAFLEQLRHDQLQVNRDFEWRYIPNEHADLKQVVFSFRQESLATFYALKWQSSM